MDTIFEMITRGWNDFLARPTGPASFRFVLQPIMATIVAVRAGIRDAKEGRPPYLWGMITNPAIRRETLHSTWRQLWRLFLLGVVLDVIYQVSVHRFIYPLELIFTVLVLVFVPYLLVRGVVNRIVRRFIKAAPNPHRNIR